MTQFLAFDEINVVSDIHMGGRSDFQILALGKRLGRLIEKLAVDNPDRQTALIFNGDMIDSLAEDIGGYVAIDQPEKMIVSIINDASFNPIWVALKKYVLQPNRYLVFITGNHDIELGLPVVEQTIRDYLVGDVTDLPRRNALNGAIIFATHGTGYRCRVGSANIFCTHGNETDPWNKVDYDQLAQLGLAQNAGKYVDPGAWVPNAGTRLVKDVMNDIKRSYPFVDLLKPETELIVPLLLVLAPSVVSKLRLGKIVDVGTGRLRGGFAVRDLLSGDVVDAVQVNPQVTDFRATPDALLGDNLREYLGRSSAQMTEDDLLANAEHAIAQNEPLYVPDNENENPETLGLAGYFWDRIRGVDKYEALRRALLDKFEKVQKELDLKSLDNTFDLDTRDATFETITERASDDIHFIITGHTHLERAIRIREDAKRFYYNCGTWIRLLNFSDYCLRTPMAFKKVCEETLESHSIRTIDAAKMPVSDSETRPFVRDCAAMVRIEVSGDAVEGKLFHVHGGDDGKPVTLEVVPGSEFARQ